MIMNNNTGFTYGPNETELLIADIKNWQKEDSSSVVLSPKLEDWLKSTLSLNRQARILLKRTIEIL